MLSTYYIYYIVTTYYVVNGINIIKYLHNVKLNIRGKLNIISTPCPLSKGVYCVCSVALCGVLCTVYAIGMDNGLAIDSLARHHHARSSIGFGV